MKKYTNQGFTLIELLVVIAIIGILSGIVLTSLSGARNKASDAKIQSDLSGFRTAAELHYSNAGVAVGYTNVCAGTETLPYITGLGGSSAVQCFSNVTAYAISKSLVSNSLEFWCVDSTGTSKKTASAASTTVCPAI